MAQTGYRGGYGGFSGRGGYSGRFSLLSEGPNGGDDEWLINDGNAGDVQQGVDIKRIIAIAR